eukprot:GILK01008383.1.p1 GENE.GILK01008383.1~~GILK01008383.1.p1  ORF type:complete len:832 (+),score=193.90 GILK01008383.1:1029-3524(+)
MDSFLASGRRWRELLPPSLKEFGQKYKAMSRILDDTNNVDVCFTEVISQISCYRPEMAGLLTKIRATYSKLFYRSVRCVSDIILKKDEHLEQQIESYRQKLQQVELEKETLQDRIRKLDRVILAKESELHAGQYTEQALMAEAQNLRDILYGDLQDIEQIDKELLAELPDKFKFLRDNVNVNSIKQLTSQDEPTPGLENRLESLEDVMSRVEKEQRDRQRLLEAMSDLVGTMVKDAKVDASSQVEEAELRWEAASVLTPSATTTSVTAKRQPLTASVNSNPTRRKSFFGDTETGSGLDSVSPMKKMSEEEEKQRRKAKWVWEVPAVVLSFLSNAVQTHQMGRVLPWQYFKTFLQDVIEARRVEDYNNLQHDLGPPPLPEFLVMFFIKRFTLRRVAEIKMLEFVTSLKYYSKLWARAALFAKLCGFISEGRDSLNEFAVKYYLAAMNYLHQQNSVKVPDSEDGKSWVPLPLAQQLYKAMLPWVSRNENHMKEFNKKLKDFCSIDKAPEGYVDVHATRTTLFIKCDVDEVLGLIMEEFTREYRRREKRLTQGFLRADVNQDGVFSFDEFTYLLEMCDPDAKRSPLENSRIFLTSLSMGTNGFNISCNEFLDAAKLFGIVAPVPPRFGQSIPTLKLATSGPVDESGMDVLASARSSRAGSHAGSRASRLHPSSSVMPVVERRDKRASVAVTVGDKSADQGANVAPAKQKITNFFAQHFKILRDIKDLLTTSRDVLATQESPELMWITFQNLTKTVETAVRGLQKPIRARFGAEASSLKFSVESAANNLLTPSYKPSESAALSRVSSRPGSAESQLSRDTLMSDLSRRSPMRSQH